MGGERLSRREESSVFKIMLSSGAFALALLFPMVARAATDNDLAEIRKQIRELREAYEARIQALELRLKEAEQKAAQSPALAGADPGSLRARDDTSGQRVRNDSGVNAFNPAISAILSGS